MGEGGSSTGWDMRGGKGGGGGKQHWVGHERREGWGRGGGGGEQHWVGHERCAITTHEFTIHMHIFLQNWYMTL